MKALPIYAVNSNADGSRIKTDYTDCADYDFVLHRTGADPQELATKHSNIRLRPILLKLRRAGINTSIHLL